MSFIKLQGTRLFDGYRFLEDTVLILTPKGIVADVVPAAEAGGDVRAVKGIVSPGFINCHCHLELSHLKGMIAEHTGLLKFVNQVVTRRGAQAELIGEAIMKAEAEMIQNGIVAVGDICNTIDTLPVKSKGGLYYHNFIEVIGFDPALAETNFNTYKRVYDQYCAFFKKAQVSLTPHAPYSVAPPLWELLVHFKGNHIFSIHNQETEEENEWFMNRSGGFAGLYERLGLGQSAFTASGKSSLQTYLDYFLPGQSLLLIHNVHTSEEDIQFAQNHFPSISWCLCPNANYYIGNQMPNVLMMREQKAKLVLGTDSLASNYSLNIWEELRRIQHYFPSIPLEEQLQWATSNGAKALQIDTVFGSFEKGKKPGVVVIQDDKALRFEIP